jgi:hypothetical protein
MKIPTLWQKWCKTGKHGRGARKKQAVLKCARHERIRGHFSDFILKPNLPDWHSMYPSLEHLKNRENHRETVVETRIVNDMKSHLSEPEFWRLIEHLFAVGVEKRKIKSRFGRRLRNGWSPAKHYKGGQTIR